VKSQTTSLWFCDLRGSLVFVCMKTSTFKFNLLCDICLFIKNGNNCFVTERPVHSPGLSEHPDRRTETHAGDGAFQDLAITLTPA